LQINSTVPKSTGFLDINMKSLHSRLVPLLVIVVLVSGVVSFSTVYADEDYNFEQFEDQSREKFEQMHEAYEDKRWAIEDSFNEKRFAYEDDINQQYRELEDQLNEERWILEDAFHEERMSLEDDINRQFQELNDEFEQSWNDFFNNSVDDLDYDFEKQQLDDLHNEKRMAIEEEMNRERMQLEESFQDAMRELDDSSEDKRRALDEYSRDMYRELDDSFQKEFRYLDEEFNDERRLVENEATDERRLMEKEFREQRMEEERERMAQEKEFREQMEQEYDRYDDRDDFMNMVPPEDYDTIDMIKNKIMVAFSMNEIEKYWSNGDREGLLSEILARTDLTRAEVEKIFGYAEKYDDRPMDEYDRPDPQENYDYDRIEERIQELENENRELRGYIFELEKKLDDLNQIMMEQVKVIYEWVITR